MDEFSTHRLRNVIPVLTEQRNIVVSRGASFAGHLIDLAIMQLRLTVHEISEEALSEFSNLVRARCSGEHEHSYCSSEACPCAPQDGSCVPCYSRREPPPTSSFHR